MHEMTIPRLHEMSILIYYQKNQLSLFHTFDTFALPSIPLRIKHLMLAHYYDP